MEPLVIEEDVDVRQLNVVEEEAAVEVELVAPTTQPRSQNLIGDRIVEETEEDMVEEMKEIGQSNKLTGIIVKLMRCFIFSFSINNRLFDCRI